MYVNVQTSTIYSTNHLDRIFCRKSSIDLGIFLHTSRPCPLNQVIESDHKNLHISDTYRYPQIRQEPRNRIEPAGKMLIEIRRAAGVV